MQPNSVDPRALGQRIAEFRKARGATQQEVADLLSYSRPTYIAIEKGERPVKPEEIVKLAGFFGRQVHELVRPGEPAISLQPHLRAVVGRSAAHDETALRAAVDDLQRWAEDYCELERLMGTPLRRNYPPEIALNSRVDPTELAAGEAARERQRLGLGDQPVIDLRRMLEWDVGLRIFYGDLPSAVAGMYAFTAEFGACILVNRKHPAERRRMSLVHEYGHLLVDRYRPGIDYLAFSGRKPANERFAEAFALCFLMPGSSVRRRFHDIVTASGDFQVADLRRISHFYFVSVEAMALRLEQLGLITKGSWQFLKEAKFSPQRATELLALQPQPINNEAYPERYKFLAVQAYDRGDLGDSDLASYLRCDIAKARETAATTRTSQEVTEATGEERQVLLDFGKSLLNEPAPTDTGA